MPTILIGGATRGLGHELALQYSRRPDTVVYGTTREHANENSGDKIKWISGIDLAEEKAGKTLADSLHGIKIDITIISAGYFGKESFDEPSWEDEVTMYKTSAIGPVFFVHHLFKAGLLSPGSKIMLMTSESGSITLRHESEGGGNFGHHASKAALNMIGRLLSFDLKEHNVAIGLLHPGFMRTEMTKGVGFDKFWDAGGGK